MPRPGFFNDNEYRAYPFVYKPSVSSDLTDSAVVDAGIIMGLDSQFDPTQHTVWLASVARANGALSFEFHTDAPGASAQPLVFQINENAENWTTVTGESLDGVSAAPSCDVAPAWEGYIVVGPLAALLDVVADNSTLTLDANERELEPARIQSLVKSYVRSINVANTPRVRATGPCDTPIDEGELIVNAVCMQGDIRIKEGYNCRISQVDRINEIRVAADLGAGDTDNEERCAHGGEVPLYDDEPFDEETGFYSGGPACNQVISTINGLSGANVSLVGGSGVRITTNPETNLIKVALASNNLVGNCNK